MKRNLLSLASLSFFVILAVGSVDENPSTDRPSSSIAEGNHVIVDASKGTTLQKERHEKANLGKRFAFSGTVQDVEDEHSLVVKLDTGNFADVKFVPSVAHFQKGDQVRFTATIDFFGTGILLNHTLSGGTLDVEN